MPRLAHRRLPTRARSGRSGSARRHGCWSSRSRAEVGVEEAEVEVVHERHLPPPLHVGMASTLLALGGPGLPHQGLLLGDSDEHDLAVASSSARYPVGGTIVESHCVVASGSVTGQAPDVQRGPPRHDGTVALNLPTFQLGRLRGPGARAKGMTRTGRSSPGGLRWRAVRQRPVGEEVP